MNVFLLNTNSFGGNYEYSIRLQEAYRKNADVTHCTLIVPANAPVLPSESIHKILLTDQPAFRTALLRKLHFLFRSLVNPIRLFFYLKKQPSSFIVFNDYEQLSALVWAPLFVSLRKKHFFAVILHDPDRDAYFRFGWLSRLTMKQVMRVMHLALYHEVLPDKPYYTDSVSYLAVPHGLYGNVQADQPFLNTLAAVKGERKWLGMIGNIRDEKNYTEVIKALSLLPEHIGLIIAGAKASSDVPVEEYKKQIQALGLTGRVVWIEKYLSDSDMQAVIQSCDLILLYYKETFTSQSGILNLLAPGRKKILVSDVPSALRHTVRRFDIGYIVPLNREALVNTILNALADSEDKNSEGWNAYLAYASWDHHVREVMGAVKPLLNQSH